MAGPHLSASGAKRKREAARVGPAGSELGQCGPLACTGGKRPTA
jgi:hypothetical protein